MKTYNIYPISDKEGIDDDNKTEAVNAVSIDVVTSSVAFSVIALVIAFDTFLIVRHIQMGAFNVKQSFDILFGRNTHTRISECRISNEPMEHLPESTNGLQKVLPYYNRPKSVHMSRINPLVILPSSSIEMDDDDNINIGVGSDKNRKVTPRKKTVVDGRKRPIKLEMKLKFKMRTRKRKRNKMEL